MTLLTALLPGIREVRAPLAAGYIWLVAGWIAIEPTLPHSASLAQLLGSFFRLNEVTSTIGIGIAISLAAYLVGSLSITVFSGLLKHFFLRPDRSLGDDVPYLLPPLSRQGRYALWDLVEGTIKRLTTTLGLSDTLLAEVVKRLHHRTGFAGVVRASLRWRLARYAGIRRPQDTKVKFDVSNQLTLLVLSDLEIVFGARLLGRDPELFSAIDRHRAEVEFRLAVIPPVIALLVLTEANLGALPAAVLVAVGLAAVVGLMWDGFNRQRQANDMLVVALADARVRCPTLERLEAEATGTKRPPASPAFRE